jgi:cytochrome c-type biogenesis protein CcmE
MKFVPNFIKKYKYFPYVIVITTIAVSLVSYIGGINYKKTNIEICLTEKELTFGGVVLETYIDKEKRWRFTMILFDGKKRFEHVNYAIDRPDLYIDIGDSVYKPQGSFEYFIYKPDQSLIHLQRENFDCDYWTD